MSDGSQKAELRETAIEFRNVVKRYPLYASPAARVGDLLGMRWAMGRNAVHHFTALDCINFSIGKGERVGIIGRNGAGKTTLLRLVTQKHAPTSGKIVVNGSVQALMDLGVGLHEEFSGRDNVKSALAYNGIPESKYDAIVEDIINFCELGDFIEMPIKTYSAGMKMRLYFAVATAIAPEILIVDEVLGAGDQYFAARSAERLKDLCTSGCTLLLVSHSMQQVIEFCERAMWIEGGRVVCAGPTLGVVKAYEAFAQMLTHASAGAEIQQASQDRALREEIVKRVLEDFDREHGVAGGISRWPATGRVRTIDFWAETLDGTPGAVSADAPLDLVIEAELCAEEPLAFRACAVIFSSDGNWITRIISPPLQFSGQIGERIKARARLDETILAPGNYVVSISLHHANEPWDLVSAERFDLVSRSYFLKINGDASTGPALARLAGAWRPVSAPEATDAVS